MKRLMFLISTEGKSVEQIAEEGLVAFQTYQKVSEKVKEKMLQEEARDIEELSKKLSKIKVLSLEEAKIGIDEFYRNH